MTTEADQETLLRISDQLDEVIAMFAETHAQTAELRRVLERTCRRAEEGLVLARAIRRLRRITQRPRAQKKSGPSRPPALGKAQNVRKCSVKL